MFPGVDELVQMFVQFAFKDFEIRGVDRDRAEGVGLTLLQQQGSGRWIGHFPRFK